MAQRAKASPEYRRRWGCTEKRIPVGHPKREARYRRAMERITPERREQVTLRAVKACGLPQYPHAVADILRVDDLRDHKLGIRKADREHAIKKAA